MNLTISRVLLTSSFLSYKNSNIFFYDVKIFDVMNLSI